ncbi:hypothetical protein CCC_03599 [Paramagnetospirillum magnetotacticum MS-1]|uniref:Uncharacterized protein n=1 Tax=Paramagnetospirillum magnetotacticum MS-1 TaxID=272627 RepID=A0A0C2UZR4_PARME|nr:hypothetical protein [Paramagnetospirillum magnetotacticum]KIL98316.1 hypothetical protein CCC_03599 [Paramagnetospirillum magnetotacticum MS-1]
MRHFIALLLMFVWGGSALAAEPALDLLDVPVSYAAAFSVTSSRGTYHGRVWHAPGLERREVATTGGGQGILIDRKADSATLLGLSGKWYVGLSLRAAAGMVGGLDAWQANRTRLRDETVGGLRATRWKTLAEGPKGGFSGDIWTSRDGIVVKAVGVLSSADGDDSPVEMTLSDVRVGPVDRQMFDVPKGWFGFDLRQVPPDKVVQAVESLRPMLEGRKGK